MADAPSSSFGYRPQYTPNQVRSLSDVEITSVANNEILKWDSTKEKWVNATNSGGGGNVSTPGLSNTSRLVRVTGANQISESGVSADASDNITGVNDLDVGGNLTVTGTMGGITAAERTQLQNIDTTTISTAQWGYVGGLNQALATSSSPTFAALTVVGDMGGITAAERTQLQNIDATTISTTQWGYVGAQDQGTATTDTPTFTGLSANSQKITDLADPTASTDAVSLNYLNVYHPSTQAKLVSFERNSPSFYTITTGLKMIWDTDQFPSSSLISYNSTLGEFTLTTGYLYHITIAANIQYNTPGGGGANGGRIQSFAGTICLNRNAGRIGEVDSLAMSAFYDCNGRSGADLVVWYEYIGVGEMYVYKGASMCITPIRYTQT